MKRTEPPSFVCRKALQPFEFRKCRGAFVSSDIALFLTQGTLLKQHLDESLDGTCPASKTIEDSMQDEAIMSLKLDITKDSEKSPVKLSDTQDDIESSDIEADFSRTRPGRVGGLLIHESDDDTDDSDRSVESNTHNDPNDLNDYKVEKAELLNAKCEQREENSSRHHEDEELLCKKGTDEDTLISHGKTSDLDIRQSGFFSLESLQETRCTLPDVISERNSSEAKGHFSSEVTGDSLMTSDTKNDVRTSDAACDSHDYMLAATQAYTIVDSDDGDGDIDDEDIEGLNNAQTVCVNANENVKNIKRDDVELDSKRREVVAEDPGSLDKNANFKCSDFAQTSAFNSELAFRRKATQLPDDCGNIMVSLTEGKLPEMYHSEQECDTLKRSDSNQAESGIPSHIFAQEAETIELHQVEQEAKTIALHDVEQEAKTIALHDVEQEAKTIALHDVVQEVKTIALHDVEQEAKTIALHDVEQEAKTIALHDAEQEAKTIALHDEEQEAKTIVLHDVEQEVKTISLHDVEQEAKTIALHDVEQEAKTIALHDVEQEAKTIALHDEEQEAKTIALHDVEQEANAIFLNDISKQNSIEEVGKNNSLNDGEKGAMSQVYHHESFRRRSFQSPENAATLPGRSLLKHSPLIEDAEAKKQCMTEFLLTETDEEGSP